MILAAVSHLVFSILVSRHGVRSLTSTPAAYSWPDWTPVQPGYLTRHGYNLITFIGTYDKENNGAIDCAKRNVFVYADIDQRTLETASAYVQGMCGSPSAIPVYHDVETGAATHDPIFNAQDWLAGKGIASPSASEAAVRRVVGEPLDGYVSEHGADFNQLQSVMNLRCATNCPTIDMTRTAIASKNGLSELNGPVKTASGYAEDLFLEAAECRPLHDMGFADQQSFEKDIEAAMRLHVLAYDFNARNEYNSAIRGSNLFAHIVGLMESKIGSRQVGVDTPDMKNYAVALISGHDTQLGALGGILHAHWPLANGLVPDDMPPGGALVFDLYETGGQYTVRLRFVYETLAQFMSNAPIKDGIQSAPVSEMPMDALVAKVMQYERLGYVQMAWTPMSDAPVALAPLTDPAWSTCKEGL